MARPSFPSFTSTSMIVQPFLGPAGRPTRADGCWRHSRSTAAVSLVAIACQFLIGVHSPLSFRVIGKT